jgi:hypothetical protein
MRSIADNLSKAGWSWGCVSAVDSEGRAAYFRSEQLFIPEFMIFSLSRSIRSNQLAKSKQKLKARLPTDPFHEGGTDARQVA